MPRKITILLAAGCCATAALVAVGVLRGLARTPHDSTTYAMSTIVTQRAYGLQAEQAMRQVESTLREFEGRLSLFDQDSEIAAINAAAGEHPARVSAATFGLLRQSLALSATSEGAFDITIAPLTQLWGITTDHPRVPTQQEIDGALALVGDAEVQLDQQASTVYSALHDKVSFAKELPQSVLDYYRDVVLYRVYSYAKNYGTTMTTLLKSGMLGTSYDSIDAYLEDIQGSLNTITEQALLMQAIAEKQGVV